MPDKKPIRCEPCDSDMNHHAEKLAYDEETGSETVNEVHTCPKCGKIHAQKAE